MAFAKTKIIVCTCRSEFQDKLYGISRRVYNLCGAGDKNKYRCTVCQKENEGATSKK